MKNKRADAPSGMFYQIIMIIFVIMLIILVLTLSTASGATWVSKIKEVGTSLGWG